MHNCPIPKTAPLHLRSSSTTSNSTAPDSARRDSSLQKVWAEDYYADDYAGGLENRFDDDTGGLSPPPAATLTTRPFPRSIPLSSDEEAFPARDHRQQQRSLTSLLPFRSRINSESPTRSAQISPQNSPVKEKLDIEFMATLSGDKDGKIRVADKSKGGLSSWFSGSSAPVAVGIVNEQDEFSMASPQGPLEQTGKLPRRPTLATLDSPTTIPTKAPTSRWGLFSAPKTPVAKTIQIPAGMMTEDEIFTLDINKALFPSGTPSDRDPFSPSSFKNLLMNAEGLLLKLQTAYKIRTISLHEITAEKEVQAEELEEADLRAKHLKLQLEDMGRKLQSQDAAIAELTTELAQEKKARAEEREAREKSIALVRFSREELAMKAINGAPTSPQVHDEDLGISHAGQRKHKWRKSNLSIESTEGESDDDTTNDSVFSRSRSPTFADSSNASIMTSETAPEVAQASFGRIIPSQALPTIGRPKPVQQASTFQKILKGISSSDTPPKENMGGVGLEEGCSNCRGGDSGVAWDAVGLLRAENKGLKERVGKLEDAVDGALDMCDGIWLRRVQ